MHLNAARSKGLKAEQPLSAFGWSSYPQYLAAPSQRPSWLRVERLLGEWGIPKDSAAGRQVFAKQMEWRRGQDLRGEFKRVERGWCLGGRSFGRSCWGRWRRPGPSHFGEAVREADTVQAKRLAVAGLNRIGWSEPDLKTRRKGSNSLLGRGSLIFTEAAALALVP